MAFMEKAVVVYPPDQFPLLEKIHSFALTHHIKLIDVTEAEFLERPGQFTDQADHVVTLVTDQTAHQFIDIAKTLNFSLGFVPIIEGGPLATWFNLPQDRDQAIRLAFEDDPEAIDILRCNNEVVLGSVTLGETPFISQRSTTWLQREENPWRFAMYWLALLWRSFRNLFSIEVIPATLTTEKKEIKTAITGIVAIENEVNSAAARILDTTISVQDNRVSVVAIAPKSVTEYLSFLLQSLIRRDSQRKLPGCISYIKTRRMTIKTQKPIRVALDGRANKTDHVELEMYPRAVRINMSDAYHDFHAPIDDNKDTMRIDNLPQNEDRIALISRHLPLFTHALEDDFRELFIQIRDSAQAHPHYLALMVLSSVVATLGLFLSSTAIIIGAMVLAPLMAPIVAIAMGLLRSERTLTQTSLRTIGIGVVLGLATSAFLALLVPVREITPEIAARLQPTLLDLGVAIACGIAGAYAYARAAVMRSLPGVAIAVALVPPLCVAGIGLGWANLQMMYGAGLLLLTNLVGIAGAAALTFLVLGYAPVKRARKGLTLTFASVGIIAIPLAFAFASIYQTYQIERDLSQRHFFIAEQTIELTNVEVTLRRNRIAISADTVGTQPLDLATMQALRDELETRWDRPVELELGFRYRL
ncbi:DUF389 domain-containing protein [Aliidiomarina sanyensis]|uniref:DUF389 domain-containing protein n=1 Tax=Aliidiomarina sanyensis TaxID=1249555 RepID=A0A432WQ41_9GAMM|nr:DUF389 domain-containing protein [Aliidiomarina sanyensis]RUO35797.1 hypothetical protein CWE11_03315 [Aliidiomarina sanyensis]